MDRLYEPIVRTKFSDMAAGMFTVQKHPQCADFEMRYYTCKEAHGSRAAATACKDYRDDLQECIYKFKQIARVHAMKIERDRQYKAGERTNENYFGPVPPPDSF